MVRSSILRAGCNGRTLHCQCRDSARSDQEILATIFLKVRELYQKEGGKFPDPILNTAFAYTTPYSPSLSEVAKETQR
jgi:hypothetical protein